MATSRILAKTPKFILEYFFNEEVKGNSVYVWEKHELAPH